MKCVALTCVFVLSSQLLYSKTIINHNYNHTNYVIQSYVRNCVETSNSLCNIPCYNSCSHGVLRSAQFWEYKSTEDNQFKHTVEHVERDLI